MKFAALVAVIAVACGVTDPTPSPFPVDTTPPDSVELNILFIGNSLTQANDLPGMVAALLDSVGAGPTTTDGVLIGGTGLEDHWRGGVARALISQGTYDFVVLQQGPSATEGRPSLLQYSELFAGEIHAAGATPALYMVWPAQERDFDFPGVSDSYRAAADLAKGTLVPAGDVWRAAWQRDPNLPFYSADRFHPSILGTYAAALTMATVFSHEDPHAFPLALTTTNGVSVDIPEDQALVVMDAVASELADG